MSEKKDEKFLVFQDDWCQVWHNPTRNSIVVEDRRTDAAYFFTLEEWWTISRNILQIRNSSDPNINRGILPKTDCPKVPAKLSQDRKTFKIICPYCNEPHTHGAGDNGDLYGHRVAHCNNRSKESNADYELVPEK